MIPAMPQLQKARIVNILLFIALVIAIVLYCKKYDQEKMATEAMFTASENAIFWKDKAGNYNAEISVLKLDRTTFRKYHDNLVDSLKKQGIKYRNVERVVLVNKVTSDTVRLIDNRFMDDWTNFVLNGDSLQYAIEDSLSLITHYKKYGFLYLKSKYVVRATSFNPNTTLTGITSTEIIPKVRRVSFGFYTGYGLNLSKGEVRPGFQFGAGIQWRVF